MVRSYFNNVNVLLVMLLFLRVMLVCGTRKLENLEDFRYVKNCNSSSSSFVACIICNYAASKANGNGKQQQQPKRLRGDITRENNTTVSDVFTTIYSKRIWGDSGGGSGDGSKDLCGVTAKEALRQILFRYNAASILDAPCGGVHSSWMKQTILKIKSDLPCFRYGGVDVVESVVHKNRGAFKLYDEWVQFYSADLSAPTTRLPSGYDLILSRDALQHLSYKAIAGAFKSYCGADSMYVLIGSYLATEKNRLIAIGETFAINVLLPPFSLPKPMEIFTENQCHTDAIPPVATAIKSLLLYNLPALCSDAALISFIAAHAHA